MFEEIGRVKDNQSADEESELVLAPTAPNAKHLLDVKITARYGP